MDKTAIKKVLTLVLAVIIIGALFFALKPKPQTGQHTQATQSKPGPMVRAYTLEIKDGTVVGGNQVLTANQGDEIHITVTSNVADELHLHGYDKDIELAAGQPADLNFTANLSGRFEAEFHHLDKTVFVLEVQPK